MQHRRSIIDILRDLRRRDLAPGDPDAAPLFDLVDGEVRAWQRRNAPHVDPDELVSEVSGRVLERLDDIAAETEAALEQYLRMRAWSAAKELVPGGGGASVEPVASDPGDGASADVEDAFTAMIAAGHRLDVFILRLSMSGRDVNEIRSCLRAVVGGDDGYFTVAKMLREARARLREFVEKQR